MIEFEPERCVACGHPLTQLGGGHRKRCYCDEACRQRAHRERQAEQGKAERKEILREIQEQAARLGKLEEEKQALLSEFVRHEEVSRQQEVQIEQLLTENARLRRRLDVETRYRMDTGQYHFKAWLKKQPFPPGGMSQRIVDDKALPPQASRAHYEALLRSLHYSDEEIETFRDLWKAMLLL